LHEFGHTLGLIHGWAAAEAKCESEFDWDYVYDFMGKTLHWEKQTIDQNLRSLQTGVPSQLDRQSVMNYHFPAEFFQEGVQSRYYAEPLTDLSLRDKLAVFYYYK